jgi:hypothetical protein
MRPALTRFLIGACCLFALPIAVRAHQPVLEDQLRNARRVIPCGDYFQEALPITDPTQASLAIFGRLGWPDEIDLYTFVPAKSESIPIEALVPAQQSNQNFRPAILIIGRDIQPQQQSELPAEFLAELPIKLPENFRARVIKPPEGKRGVFFEKRMLERFYRGNEQQVRLTAGQPYYLALYEPNHFTGSYTLGIGSAENFKDASKYSTLKNILAIKMGAFGGKPIPWLDLLGLSLLSGGLTLGMASVIVVWLSRSSTSLTINAADMSNRLLRVVMRYVRAGILIAIAGGAILYRQSQLSGVATFQALLGVALIAYAVYLHTRRKRTESGLAIFSLVWFFQLFLLAWYLLIVR